MGTSKSLGLQASACHASGGYALTINICNGSLYQHHCITSIRSRMSLFSTCAPISFGPHSFHSNFHRSFPGVHLSFNPSSSHIHLLTFSTSCILPYSIIQNHVYPMRIQLSSFLSAFLNGSMLLSCAAQVLMSQKWMQWCSSFVHESACVAFSLLVFIVRYCTIAQ